MSIIKRFIHPIKIFIIKLSIRYFPSMLLTYQYFRDNRLSDPRDTPMGFKFIGHPSMENGTFEPEETKIVDRILEKVDVVVNVGANIGYYCCIALQKGKYVIAFEPVAGNLRRLYKNLKANHWEDRIEIFPFALSNKIGIIQIFGGGASASLIEGWANTPEQYFEFVPTSTMDFVLGNRFNGKRCFFIVDIEGAEKLMLEGASASLSYKPKPVWLVEISIGEHQPKGIAINPHILSTFQVFWARGYEAWTADEHLRLVNEDEIQGIVATGKDSLFTHNFLFIEKGKKGEIID